VVRAWLSISVFAVTCLAQPATLTYAGIGTLRPSGSGGRVAWSRVLNLVVYDKVSATGYYDVYTMNPDGSNDQCLTCNHSSLPPGHKGNPDFDYSGKWIIFQAEKTGTAAGFDKLASPGSGLFNDVWMMDVKGTNFYQLTNVPKQNSGVLHAHFSHSGNQVTYAQMVAPSPLPLGKWEVQIADLTFTGGVPSLQNTHTYQPGPIPGFYETHGFSADDQSVYFTANPEPQQQWFGVDIYRFTPATGNLLNLTNTPNDWDEHADLSPDGTKILWVSSTGIQLVSGDEKTDYWIMDVDGSNKRRLTWFNTPGFPESQSSPVAAARSAWSPDGTYFLGYVVTDNFGNAGPIVSISLVAPGTQVSAASYKVGPAAPGSIVSFYSRNMSVSPQAASVPLSTTLGTTTITVVDSGQNKFPAQLYYASAGVVNYVLPAQAALGPANVSVFRDGFLVASGTVQLQPVAPALFTANASGTGVAAAEYLRYTGSASSFFYVFQCASGGGTCTTSPIDLGGPSDVTILILFGTGLQHPSGLSGVTATAGGQQFTVQYAGAQGTFPGMDQINLQVPRALAGAGPVTLTLSVDGVAANPVQLAFK
jgi:uncharacterized protein (TIGR03437 family)